MASSSLHMKAQRENKKLPNWLELPRDITANILRRLDTVEIVTRACHVCPLWWNICKDPLMWRTICITIHSYPRRTFLDLEKICHFAVERSCGHLEEINFEFSCNDDLIEYIAENASTLRRIRLYCHQISDKGLSVAVRKLPQLEEVDIFSYNFKDSLKVICRSCPCLKSLKFWRQFSADMVCNDEEAFAIAESCSGLQHLNIRGNELTNVGLIATLDGCPLLKSLDIIECYNLDLSGSLKQRCLEQIKDLKLPAVFKYRNYNNDYYQDSPSDSSDYDSYDSYDY